MKGIILAGGKGTRLYPLTEDVNKHLLPVYDKPIIYYPLATLMLAGIRDILIISRPEDVHLFQKLLQDGSKWGINIRYTIQKYPRGLAEAFIIGEEFIDTGPVCLALGDNIFHGHNLSGLLQDGKNSHVGATLFAYQVNNPEFYGVLDIDEHGNILGLEEKPQKPKSNYAVTGLYMYDYDVVEIAKVIRPSLRNELEITDVNKIYLQQKKMNVKLIPRGFTWLDVGTPSLLLEASNYVALLEKRQGLRIMCPEEIAWRQGYIDDEQFLELGEKMKACDYKQYILSLLDGKKIKNKKLEVA